MKIFYSGYSRKADVPSSEPVEADVSEAIDVLWNLDHRGIFTGLELNEGFVFQTMNEGDYFYSEFLNRGNMDTKSANLDIEEVEGIIDELYSGTNPENLLKDSKYEWKKGNLKDA